MTRSRSRTAAKPSVTVDEKDPQSWLFLNPAGSDSGLTFGVLRKVYGGRANSALEFGLRKLCPVAAPIESPTAFTAARWDVVLPEHAEDALADPRMLLRTMDEVAIDKSLLVYLTLGFPDACRLHTAWEVARGFGRHLAQERKLASLVIMHAPGLVSSPNPVHAHLLLCPRAVSTPLGIRHGVYDNPLVHDTGQEVLSDIWRAYRDRSISH